MNEMQTYQPGAAAVARTPETLGAEVRNLTNAARYITVYYAIEIGRRLTEAKELVAHGEWMDWLKNETELSQSAANRLMRIYAEYGQKMGLGIAPDANSSMLNNLSVSNALRLLAVPEEERETFAETVGAEHLSTRELEEAIRERDEAKAKAQKWEETAGSYASQLNDAQNDLQDVRGALNATADELAEAQKLADEETARAEAAEKRVKELESRPVEVAVQEPDPAEIERRVQEATEAARAEKAAAEQKLAEEKEKAKAAADKLREKLKAAEEKLASAGAEDKAAAETAQAEISALKKQLAMSGEEMVTFKLRFAEWQEAYAAMLRALAEVEKLDGEKAAKGAAAIRSQAEKWSAA